MVENKKTYIRKSVSDCLLKQIKSPNWSQLNSGVLQFLTKFKPNISENKPTNSGHLWRKIQVGFGQRKKNHFKEQKKSNTELQFSGH